MPAPEQRRIRPTAPAVTNPLTGRANDVVVEFRHPLPRLTKKVFTDLAIWMTGLGLVIGIAFPFFVLAFGVPREFVITPKFFVATIGAGLLVGVTNHYLSSLVVRSRLQFMRAKMSKVEHTLRNATYTDDAEACTPEKCSIPVDSQDELGEAASSFNHLVEAFAASQNAARVARQFATTLSSHIELTPLVDAALGNLQDAGKFSASALCILRDGELVTFSANGMAQPAELASSDLVQRAFRTIDSIAMDVTDDVLLDGGIVNFRPRSVIAYPLHIRLIPIGVLVLASTHPFSEADDELIRHLLPNFSVALNNALSHEQLQRFAAIDPLTGLYNRRFGLERLSEDFSRSVRSKEPLGLVLFDIDHFKTVNDTYGHQAGDHVLVGVAGAVKGVLREGDTLMRYGGEEFLIVLPGAGESDVRSLAERIRRVVESTVLSHGTTEIRVTVSLGAVAFPNADVVDVEDLIRTADAAMYDAKNSGRNRLTFIDA